MGLERLCAYVSELRLELSSDWLQNSYFFSMLQLPRWKFTGTRPGMTYPAWLTVPYFPELAACMNILEPMKVQPGTPGTPASYSACPFQDAIPSQDIKWNLLQLALRVPVYQGRLVIMNSKAWLWGWPNTCGRGRVLKEWISHLV